METHTTTAGTNGAAPPDLAAAAADLLAERLAQIDAALAELEPLRDEQKRLTGALRAIAPEHPRVERAPKPGPKPRTKPADRGWSVSQGKLDAVLEAMRVLGEPASATTIAERAGIAGETARKALGALRDDELVRVAGTANGPGGTRRLYALMPEGNRAA